MQIPSMRSLGSCATLSETKRGMSAANFFLRVDVCEKQVHCKIEIGESARYMQAAIESLALCPNLKRYTSQRPLCDFVTPEVR
jgi:hypothetical protein